MKYSDEGPKGIIGGLIAIIALSLITFAFSFISSGIEKGLSILFNEPPDCFECEVDDAYMEGLCIDCLQEKYDYDVWCCYCDKLILHTDHYFKGYCNDCAKDDWSEYFCSSCSAYTDNPNSLVNGKCARCNK